MSFITAWIEKNMEDPASREAVINNGIRDVNENRKNNVARWNEPALAPEGWKNTWFHAARQQDFVSSGSDGKQCKYYANPTSRANSYDSVLDIYTVKEQQYKATASV